MAQLILLLPTTLTDEKKGHTQSPSLMQLLYHLRGPMALIRHYMPAHIFPRAFSQMPHSFGCDCYSLCKQIGPSFSCKKFFHQSRRRRTDCCELGCMLNELRRQSS